MKTRNGSRPRRTRRRYVPWRRPARGGRTMADAHEPTEAGYSLISVIVALLLLVVGVISLSNVLTQSISMQTIMSTRTTALSVAQTYMEDLKSRNPLTLASESVVQVDEDGQPSASGVFSREVLVDSAGRNLLRVAVIVTTPRSRPIRLTTWVYDGAY